MQKYYLRLSGKVSAMKGIVKKCICSLLGFVFSFTLLTVVQPENTVNADEIIAPVVKNNIDWISAIKYNYLFLTDSGYGRVVCTGEKIYAEEYNDSFEIQCRQEIPIELLGYAGFYSGEDNYFFQ